MLPYSSQLQSAPSHHAFDEADDFDTIVRALYDGAYGSQSWQAFETALCHKLDATEVRFSVLHGKPPMQPAGLASREVLELTTDICVDLPAESVTAAANAAGCEPVARGVVKISLAAKAFPLVPRSDMDGSGNCTARLRVTRLRAKGRFSATEQAFLTRLSEHLRGAAWAYLRVKRLMAERVLLMDQLLPATIFLDKGGCIVQISEAARSLLAREKTLCITNNRITLRGAQEAANWQVVLARVLRSTESGGAPTPEVLCVPRAQNDSPLWMVARPLVPGFGIELYRIAVLLYPQDARPNISIEALQHMLGLTWSETVVALGLANGKTVKELTKELGVSLNTTRTHLRSIFTKIHVDKQTKLVRTVLHGMSVVNAQR